MPHDVRIDHEGYRTLNPTPDEVIANTRPDARDGVSSAWQIRSYGLSLLLLGNVDLAGVLTWHVVVPWEVAQKPPAPGPAVPLSDRVFMRSMQVFPPPSEDAVCGWSWRPLDAENWKPVRWDDVAVRHQRGEGRALHEAMVAECQREDGAPA